MPPPKKNSSKSPAAKKGPKSAFSGKYTASPSGLGKKDGRNVVMFEGLQGGMMILYVKKGSKMEEAFITPTIDYLQQNGELMEEIGVNAILYRKGADGKTEMPKGPKSTYSWKQLLMIVGEDNNTVAGRREAAKVVVEFFNKCVVDEELDYKFQTKTRLGTDETCDPPRSVDSCLLDSDVVALMKEAYPDVEMEELKDYNDIMETFWSDIEHGKEVVESLE